MRFNVALSSFFLLWQAHKTSQLESVKVIINLEKVVFEVSDCFLSFALDSGLIVKHWKSIDFSSERLNTLAKALSPAYLRVGGNAADFLIFKRDADRSNIHLDPTLYDENYAGFLGQRHNISKFFMTAKDFDKVNQFATTNSLRLLFDLNVLTLRDESGNWNSTNAREILDYSVEKGYNKNLHFSLGNEPNSFPHAFNLTISAHQLGKDFLSLYRLLRETNETSKYFHKSLLVGPDVTQPKKKSLEYLNDFLDVAGSQINATTWHQYYVDGRTATVDDMMSRDVLNSLVTEMNELSQTMTAAGFSNSTVWMGETGSCWGGGAPGLSDRYVAGFMWLDKLGQAALNHIQVVIRQSFFGGHYALVDKEFNPNPDFWLSWLYRMLVGKKVFDVKVNGTNDVRLYAHCSEHIRYSTGSLTLFGMNLGDSKVNLDFTDDLLEQEKHLYWFLPFGSEGLKSQKVAISGKLANLTDDRTLPDVIPQVISKGKNVQLPENSFGFIVFPDAKASECL